MTIYRPRTTLRTALQQVTLLCMVAFSSFCFVSLYSPARVYAQETAVEGFTRWMNAREKKEDQIDDHLKATDSRVSSIESDISRIYGVGLGFMGVMSFLQAWQMKHGKGER